MKSQTLVFAAVMVCLLETASAQSRFVTLTIGGTNLLDEVTIGTNEVAEIRGSFDSQDNGNNNSASNVEVRKGNQLMRLGASQLSPGYGGYRGSISIAGPATFSLKYASFLNPTINAFLTLQIIPESFPPDKTIILPAGTGANIILESSIDLIHWTTNSPGIFTNNPANQFFRLRADRIP